MRECDAESRPIARDAIGVASDVQLAKRPPRIARLDDVVATPGNVVVEPLDKPPEHAGPKDAVQCCETISRHKHVEVGVVCRLAHAVQEDVVDANLFESLSHGQHEVAPRAECRRSPYRRLLLVRSRAARATNSLFVVR